MAEEEQKQEVQEQEETTEEVAATPIVEEQENQNAEVGEAEEDEEIVEKIMVNGKEISEEKVNTVNKLAEEMKAAKTIMLVSIKNLPSPQLQKIKKQLREKAKIQVVKKNLLTRAIDSTKIKELEGLKEHLEADMAIATSNDDAFELAAWLTENRNPIAAKAGQEAPADINVEPGPTDLMPGPDISLLSGVGLQVAVEDGKLAIKEPHIILKQGDLVDENIASVLLKLDIKPFLVGLSPAVIYDSSSKKIYVGIKIDKEEALNNLLYGYSKALGFAQSLELMTKETIGYLLAKANAHASSLEKLTPAEPSVEEKKEETAEEKPAEQATEEVKEEEKKEEETQTENKSEEESK